jgi:hypothetical protein
LKSLLLAEISFDRGEPTAPGWSCGKTLREIFKAELKKWAGIEASNKRIPKSKGQ